MSEFNENDFDTIFTLEDNSGNIIQENSLHILLTGDWAGESSYFGSDLSKRTFTEVDRDNFDDLIRKIVPEITLDFPNSTDTFLKIKFRSLDDFHPENLFQNVFLFDYLRDVRQRLANIDSFEATALEVENWYRSEKFSDQNNIEQSNQENTYLKDNQELLEQILNVDQPVFPKVLEDSSYSLSRLVSKIVTPHTIKIDFQQQSELITLVDGIISELMRGILHHPKFQALESSWRGLHFLTRRVETDYLRKIHFLQLTKEELIKDLADVQNLSNSLYRNILQSFLNTLTSIKSRCALFANHSFSTTVSDIATLIRLSKVHCSQNLAIITNYDFHSKMNEDDSPDSFADDTANLEKLWDALRSVPESRYLGVTAPRFIGRMPYGKFGEKIEVFSFDEFSDGKIKYLWINSSFAYACYFSNLLEDDGFLQDKLFHINDLPVCFYDSDGHTVNSPLIEFSLSENLRRKVFEQGIMVVFSYPEFDSVRLSPLRSVLNDFSSLLDK